MKTEVFTPFPKQQQMLLCKAEWLLYGGGVGGGKSLGIIFHIIQYLKIPNFSMVVFRREYSQFKKPGGFWMTILPFLKATGARINDRDLTATWPNGCKLACVGLQHEKDKEKHQGVEYGFVGWDELTHFTQSQFTYLASRNRNTKGVHSHFRMTCNPDSESWVRQMVDPYISEDGTPDLQKCGQLCYITKQEGGDNFIHGWTLGELAEKLNVPRTEKSLLQVKDQRAKTFTFMPSMITDNPRLANDKSYMRSLFMLNPVERQQKLGGNWNARIERGTLFNPEKFYRLESVSGSKVVRLVRGWDLAATEETLGQNPDYTVGVKMAEMSDGSIVVLNVVRFRGDAGQVEKVIAQTALEDRIKAQKEGMPDPDIIIEEEVGSSAKFTSRAFTHRILKNHNVFIERATKDKVTRARPFSTAQANRKVYVYQSDWTTDFVNELGAFPSAAYHDDQVDASSLAFNHIFKHFEGGDELLLPGEVMTDEYLTSDEIILPEF